MESLFSSSSNLGVAGVLILGVCGVVYLISSVRRSDMKVLRESNDDLRASIDDRGKEMIQMHQDITSLRGRVGELERTNKTLEDLVVVALKQYFFDNPTVAKTLQKIITNQKP